MDWTLENWINSGSALVALLSAVYTRYQYSSAKKANAIALHSHQLEVYASMRRFIGHLTAKVLVSTRRSCGAFSTRVTSPSSTSAPRCMLS
jgi:hypothetical protein